MWLLLGIAAVIAAIINVIWTVWDRDAKWFRFISLSLTAFTLCAFFCRVERWVAVEDWSALQDVVPGMAGLLCVLTAASVVINSISLFKKNGK